MAITPGVRTSGRPQRLRLGDVLVAQKAISQEDFWSRVSRNVAIGQMPPPYAVRKPTDEERARLIDWLNDAAGCRATVIAAAPRSPVTQTSSPTREAPVSYRARAVRRHCPA